MLLGLTFFCLSKFKLGIFFFFAYEFMDGICTLSIDQQVEIENNHLVN